MNYRDNVFYGALFADREPGPGVPPAEAVEPFPAPEHSSRDPWPDGFEKPRAVAGLERGAAVAGVAVLAQYSRGYGMHAAHGRPTALKHMIGLRLRRSDGAVAYAVYARPVQGAASWTWQSIRTPERAMTLEELKSWMSTSSCNSTSPG